MKRQHGNLSVSLHQRTFHFAWCNQTVVDYTCVKCQAIVLDGTCIHCQRAQEKKAQRLREFLAKRAEEN